MRDNALDYLLHYIAPYLLLRNSFVLLSGNKHRVYAYGHAVAILYRYLRFSVGTQLSYNTHFSYLYNFFALLNRKPMTTCKRVSALFVFKFVYKVYECAVAVTNRVFLFGGSNSERFA